MNRNIIAVVAAIVVILVGAGVYAVPRVPILLFSMNIGSLANDAFEENDKLLDSSKDFTKKILALDMTDGSDRDEYVNQVTTMRGQLMTA